MTESRGSCEEVLGSVLVKLIKIKKKSRFTLVLLVLSLLLPFSCFESRWQSPYAASLSLKLSLGKKIYIFSVDFERVAPQLLGFSKAHILLKIASKRFWNVFFTF